MGGLTWVGLGTPWSETGGRNPVDHIGGEDVYIYYRQKSWTIFSF